MQKAFIRYKLSRTLIHYVSFPLFPVFLNGCALRSQNRAPFQKCCSGKEFRPLINPDSTQSEARQFSKIVLNWFQSNVLRGLHPNSNTKGRIDGLIFAYAHGHGLYAPGQIIGYKLMKQPAAAKEIPGLNAVLAMVGQFSFLTSQASEDGLGYFQLSSSFLFIHKD